MTRSILVAVDFSDHGRAAFDVACTLARDMQARLVLVHAIAPVPHAVAIRPEVEHGLDESRREIGAGEAAELTASWAERARDLGIDVDPVLEEEEPAKLILAEADAHSAEMVVVCTHGRTGLRRVLTGSVAQEVLRGSDRPVVVVPKP